MFNAWPAGPAAPLHKLKEPGSTVMNNELCLKTAIPEPAWPGLDADSFKPTT